MAGIAESAAQPADAEAAQALMKEVEEDLTKDLAQGLSENNP